jgi:hypothetical protein
MDAAIIGLRYPDGRVEQRALPPGKYLLGREAGLLTFGVQHASSLHAELEVDRGLVRINDLGSQRGIVDGMAGGPIARHTLVLRQPISLGFCAIELLRSPSDVGGNEVAPERAGGEVVGPTPSGTKARHRSAAELRDHWEGRVKLMGTVLALTMMVFLFLVALTAIGAVQYPGILLTGLTAVAEGGALKFIVHQRDEAREREERAAREAQLGTGAMREIHWQGMQRGHAPSGSSSSLWRSFRTLPLLAQAVIALYAWWVLIPLWYYDRQGARATRPLP